MKTGRVHLHLQLQKTQRWGSPRGETGGSHYPPVSSEVGRDVFRGLRPEIVDADNCGLQIKNHLRMKHKGFREGQSWLHDRSLF